MRKFLCVALSAIMLLCLYFQSFASTDQNYIKVNCDGTDAVTVSWNLTEKSRNSYVVPAENYMATILEGLLKEGFTLEEIEADSRYFFLTDKICLFVRFYYDGCYSSIPLGTMSGKKTLSLYSDIIPGFPSYADFSEGGEITAELITAPESYPDETDFCFESFTVEGTGKITVNPTGRICYIQDKNTVNKNPQCFALPLTKDIILSEPELAGNIFAGWTVNGNATDRIKAGSEYVTVTVNFTPCKYKINYVLTTDLTYSFGRADNSANPQTYTYGITAGLYSIKAPVGGYTFYGWFLNGQLVTEIPAGTTGDIVLYAKWLDENGTAALKLSNIYKNALNCSFCDLNTDGKVTVADARLTLRIAIGLLKSTSDIRNRADTDANGYINVYDARKILRIAVGKENIIDVYSAYCG